MKVKDAKHIFRQWGSSLSDDFDTMIKREKMKKPQQGMRNDNYFHALFFTDYMFRATQTKIRMLSGTEGDGFLKVLGRNFQDAVERIAENKGFAHIILLDKKVPEYLRKLEKAYPVLDIVPFQLIGFRLMKHSIVCDDYMLRAEELHEPLTEYSNVDEIRAKVYFNNKDMAMFAADTFDRLWSFVKKDLHV